MRGFLLTMYVLAAVPVLVGVTHVVLGPASDVQLGAQLPPAVLADAVLDSQNRFYGMTFVGYGALVLLSLRDLDRYADSTDKLEPIARADVPKRFGFVPDPGK